MPGFVTHYIFGVETYRKLKYNTQKKNLYYNRAAYNLGLQGPDLFFYYLPSYLGGHNIGSLAHTKETSAFFLGLLRNYEHLTCNGDRGIAEAYITGFLGHYTLDTICHPYIYAMTHYHGKEKSYFSRHAYLETDIDTSLLDSKLHRTPCSFRTWETISLTFHQKKVIANLLYDAYRYAFPELKFRKTTMYLGIFSLGLGLRILHDDSGQKKVLFRFAEKHFLGYPLFSPLIPSDTLFFRTDPLNLRHAKWANPWDTSLVSEESFSDLYEKAEALYLSRIKKLQALLHGTIDEKRKRQLVREFLTDYGNLSFHSGLSCSIPS